VSMAEKSLSHLRRRIAEIEGRPAATMERQESDPRPDPESDSEGREASPEPAFAAHPLLARNGGALLPFGIAHIDRRLGGGLARKALHEFRSPQTRDAGAVTGLALALLARLAAADRRPILWVMERSAIREAGLPYGAGLAAFGFDPGRLVIVRVRKPADALWVMEEALRCRGLAAALGEIRGEPHDLDLTSSRRLALRAHETGVMGVLLRQAGDAMPGAAATRWLVAPLPASVTDDFAAGIGRPAWRLTLERSRIGTSGTFDVEWDNDRRSFAPLKRIGPALPLSRPAPAFDRPAFPADAGAVVALRRAS